MIINMNDLRSRERYAWITSSVIPRPIAFVSTISEKGVTNLAPFSYFNAVSSRPPILSIAIGPKRGGVVKDTLANIEATRELVVNVVTEEIARPMVETSGDWDPDISEFEISGLTPVASTTVKPPRVQESPISFECLLHEIIRVGEPSTCLVLAEIVMVHVDERVLTDGLPDPQKVRPLARLSGNGYARLGELIEIERPVV